MQKKSTIPIDEEVYERLRTAVGPRRRKRCTTNRKSTGKPLVFPVPFTVEAIPPAGG